MNRADKAERLIALKARTKSVIETLATLNAEIAFEGIHTNALFDAAVDVSVTGKVLSTLADALLLESVPVDGEIKEISQNKEGDYKPTIGPAFF
jgi:hypothetical protein